ncbi:MAG: slr1659 superfamily regulator [Leptolyngbya sp. IPPAS B-1204]|uniref:STAS domain-containing protein n=1 Tax=Leptolyngbya sp. NK1-12 TaxID=2547451 RepID=A0AA97AI72_9CYAN|nr:hypothetical protein [Leptolyngbya sp. NK1-12]MBF2048492.1 hypothetical protein [Elainella sp. C42_A2020_010]RNJ65136.1 MAG: hypothetical protein EDM05_33020 [Leptolyngbya sp. IPPAS B-1204]WNZ21617.1 hypothetical protein HJG54_01165 [Leptolyngbya sp. NK1-12]
MEIQTKDYSVQYDATTATVHFQGLLLLNGTEEYAPITQLLNQLIEQQLSILTLNLQQLRMLNSSGFQMLSKFVMKARQYEDIQILIRGNQNISWQTRSLQNLQRLMPAIQIELID